MLLVALGELEAGALHVLQGQVLLDQRHNPRPMDIERKEEASANSYRLTLAGDHKETSSILTGE